MTLHVENVSREATKPYILDIHYAHRMPSISRAFGLFDGADLLGICTYGTPPSAPLRKGVAGECMSHNVIELNRLCLSGNIKNHASKLVGGSLKMLGAPKYVVSFADIAQGHIGIVYQATNFLYCGLSAKRTDWKVRGREHLHGQTIADEFRGVKNRAKAMREKYGDDFYLSPRSRKHRYIKIIGNRRDKRAMLKKLKYGVLPYPKACRNNEQELRR